MPSEIEISSNDNSFGRARKILKLLGVRNDRHNHAGHLAEILDAYKKIDELAIKQDKDNG